MKPVAAYIAWLALALGAVFGLNYFGYANFAFFAPKYEEVRRTTFEESRAFNEGMVRDLQSLRLEYLKSDDAGKAAIRSTVIHRFSVYPKDKLTPELRSFYANLEQGN